MTIDDPARRAAEKALPLMVVTTNSNECWLVSQTFQSRKEAERAAAEFAGLQAELERLEKLSLERQEWRSRIGLSTKDDCVIRAEKLQAENDRLRGLLERARKYARGVDLCSDIDAALKGASNG